jgi:dimethylamine/trimethylamine dehydrogenase
LGQRGYQVALLESRREFGGRVMMESALPGLIEWRRVVDWRLAQIDKLSNVALYPESNMTVEDILEVGNRHVIIATGASWRRDGIGRTRWKPIKGSDLPHVFTPDDLMAGKNPAGNVLIYDDDHYYMGSVLAELLLNQGCHVTVVTPAPLVAYWSQYTLEQFHTQQKLIRAGVNIMTQNILEEIKPDHVSAVRDVSGNSIQIPADGVVLVTDRVSQDGLYQELKPAQNSGKLDSLRIIGDAEAPHIIARAVFSGYQAAYEFGSAPSDGTPFQLERVTI